MDSETFYNLARLLGAVGMFIMLIWCFFMGLYGLVRINAIISRKDKNDGD